MESKGMVKGSMTIEMSFIMPILLSILLMCIFAGFYYHDKLIITGAAFESAVVGSTKMREKVEPDESELTALCRERIGEKCIFFGWFKVKTEITDEEIVVHVRAKKGKFMLNIEKKAAVTDPEKRIRDIRRIKEIGNGAKDND